MKILLLAFASAGDAVGASRLEFTLAEGSTLADLRALLDREHPALKALWPRLAVAVDGELAPADTALRDGAEVALLPPVSGGGPTPETTSPQEHDCQERVALVDEAIDLEALIRATEDAGCGAVLIFQGNVRNRHEGRPVERLTYSAYRPMALERLRRIASDLERGEPEVRVGIVHRLGDVEVGEASVAIAIASPHRAAAYEASRKALERLKAEVPIWKREHYADGRSVWREEEPLGSLTLSPS